MKHVLNISHSPDELSVDEAIMQSIDVEDGFVYSIADIVFETKKLNNILQDLIFEFGELEEFDFSRNKSNTYCKYKNDKIRLYIKGNIKDIYGSIYCKSDKIAKIAYSVINKHQESLDDISLYNYSYYMKSGQLQKNFKLMNIDEINYISESYYPYIKTDVMFNEFFTGSENILLLVGKPGLGKSKMATLALKHAFTNPDNLPYDKIKDNPGLDQQYINVAFVKSLDVLADDSFWRSLEIESFDFVILDDLDYMLTKRDASKGGQEDERKNAFLNQFLTFTDGVEKHKTKFIITTNQSYEDIDTALLRKGRLFDILELRPLNKNEALKIWKENNLQEDIFYTKFKTNEILSADLGSEINKLLNTRTNVQTNGYITEEGISKIVESKTKRKVGL